MSLSSKLSLLAGVAVVGAGFLVSGLPAEALPLAGMRQAATFDAQTIQVQDRRRWRARRYVQRDYGPFFGFGVPFYGAYGLYGSASPYGYESYAYRGPSRLGPGGAYQGNIPGCAVDLGYGRYESCDVGP